MDSLPAPAPIALDGWLLAIHSLVVLGAIGVALSLRPWRCVHPQGPPWAWCVAWVGVTLIWASVPGDASLRPMAGVTLLVLLAGWPLAMLAIAAAALLAASVGPLAWSDALQRLVWLGIAPGTCVLALGAAVRHWLPRHLLAYILGRGYLGTFLASLLAGAMALLMMAQPSAVSANDLMVANLLIASAEASLCGTLIAILTVLRPQWLATYAERLYREPQEPARRRPRA
jgi:uncharacterized membrane protein